MIYLLIIFQIIFFVGLTFLLRYFLTRNIGSVTERLEDINKDYTKKQQEAKAKLDEAERHYKEVLTNAATESKKLKEKYKKEALSEKDNIISEAHRKSEQIIESANKTRQHLLNELENQTESRALERACELIDKVLPLELHKKIHSYWFDDLVSKGFEDLGNLNIPEDTSKAYLKMAFPLTFKQKAQLSKKLKEKFNHDLELSEEVDSSLIAGAIVKINTLVIDGSLKHKVKERANVE